MAYYLTLLIYVWVLNLVWYLHKFPYLFLYSFNKIELGLTQRTLVNIQSPLGYARETINMSTVNKTILIHLSIANITVFILLFFLSISKHLFLLYFNVSFLMSLTKLLNFLTHKLFKIKHCYDCKELALFHLESPLSIFFNKITWVFLWCFAKKSRSSPVF